MDKVVRCKVMSLGSVKVWFPHRCQDDKITDSIEPEPIFMVDGDIKSDLRKHPPFHQILPCPHCGVEDD